ncbi:MAG: EF-P lysine aminoacylase EpmA [Gammaproteobacteria bacterium]|nr:EF-P lysine aminoacylase EpmA [Gammaproteobacteria bacterium]
MNWQPSATFPTLQARAKWIQRIRDFFTTRGYLEVDTPILTQFGITDVYIEQLKTSCMQHPFYLQTSPEYPMKRLLAAGSGPIFQLARVFRNDERGRWHQPEFTLLEWYQLDIDHHGLMAEMDAFLQALLGSKPLIKQTYQAVFEQYVGVNPHACSLETLKEVTAAQGVGDVLAASEVDRDQYLFLLMSHVIEPALGLLPQPTAVYDFPASQAALARIENGVAARFEIYYQGIELANGFHELQDAAEQRVRFEADRQQREMRGLTPVEQDPYFLAALSAGLPACSGVALGVDRLFALVMNGKALSEVIAFGFNL